MKTETTKGGLVIPKQPKQKSTMHTVNVYHLQDIISCIKSMDNTEYANLISVVKTTQCGGMFGSYIITYMAIEPLSFEVYC
jgi:hypothetical protein